MSPTEHVGFEWCVRDVERDWQALNIRKLPAGLQPQTKLDRFSILRRIKCAREVLAARPELEDVILNVFWLGGDIERSAAVLKRYVRLHRAGRESGVVRRDQVDPIIARLEEKARLTHPHATKRKLAELVTKELHQEARATNDPKLKRSVHTVRRKLTTSEQK
jgi:hypothetical protein